MIPNKFLTWILTLVLLVGFLGSAEGAHANPPYLNPAQSSLVTAYDLIAAMNYLRMANGLPALLEDPIVNSVAQGTAEIMAANQMSDCGCRVRRRSHGMGNRKLCHGQPDHR
jgi:hypothetical protein